MGGWAVINLREELTHIADAIRRKHDIDLPIAPSAFADLIDDIPTGSDPYEFFNTTSSTAGASNTGAACNLLIKKFPATTLNPSSCTYLMAYMRALVDASLVTIPGTKSNYAYAFYYCDNLRKLPSINWNGATNQQCIFYYCSSLTQQDLHDAGFSSAKATALSSSFRNMLALTEVDGDYCGIKMTANTSLNYTFYQSYNITKMINMGSTAKVTNWGLAFYGLQVMTTMQELDGTGATNVTQAFYNCRSLRDFGGFYNLGAAYTTTQAASYSSYTLDFTQSTILTHDSLMNIINKLYDIKAKGCKAQKLVLGSTNTAKLTAAEIAIATNKGWTVS